MCSQYFVVSVGEVSGVDIGENCFLLLIVLFAITFVFCRNPMVENAF